MATKKSKLSAVIGFGAEVDASVGKALRKTERMIKGLGKEISDTTKEQSALTREMKRLRAAGKDVDHLETQYKQLERVQKRLNRQQAGYTARLKFSRAAMSGLRRAGRAAFTGLIFGATAAIGAIAKLSLETSSYGDTLAKTSARLGVGVQALEELRFAAGLAGVDVVTFDKSFGKTIRAVGEAARLPKGTFGQAFKELGLNARELKKEKPEVIMAKMADGFARLKTRTDKVTVATQLYGDRGLKMLNLFEGGAAGIEKLRQEMRDLGIGMDEDGTKKSEEFQDQLLRVKTTFGGLSRVVGVQLLPILSETFGDLIENLKSGKINVKQLGERLATNIGGFIEGFKKAWPTIRDGVKFVFDTLVGIANIIGPIVTGVQKIARGFASITAGPFGSDDPLSAPAAGPGLNAGLANGGRKGGTVTVNQTINAAPGQSAEQIAEMANQSLERNMSGGGAYVGG